MNLFKKIAVSIVGIAMAVGVGVAIGTSGSKDTVAVYATETADGTSGYYDAFGP